MEYLPREIFLKMLVIVDPMIATAGNQLWEAKGMRGYALGGPRLISG